MVPRELIAARVLQGAFGAVMIPQSFGLMRDLFAPSSARPSPRSAPPPFVYGAGMGMIFIPLFDIILSGVEDHEVGTASGILESFQQLGASLGVAVLGTCAPADLPGRC